MPPIQRILSLVLAVAICSCNEQKPSPDGGGNSSTDALPTEQTSGGSHPELHASLARLPGQNALSQRCQECHKEIHHHWQASDHGQANRRLDLALDSEPFSGQKFTTPSENWSFTRDADTLTVTANEKSHHAGMVIGIKPLIQYLVSANGGRWQTPSAAWDPAKKEWFDVFSGDRRTELDWGHWTGRGMTWNTQCAWCHMTDYRKNYDLKSDTYDSHWNEMGVGCTQCHGHITEHADTKTGCLIDVAKHKSLKKNHPDRIFDNCATCHSRRGEFDDHFHIGDTYGDHYQLQLPTLPHLYYADGQIRDEDYVWTSLRISNMGHKGVRCTDCHDPHTTQLKLPLENNTLCMSCHAGGTNGRIDGASIIDPATHTHHKADSTGNACVECHMTNTTYMGRDPRRDHGFHVPDPQMTKEHGIPNACNKCHTDQDADWAVKWTQEWYGEKMHTPERQRQRARTRAISSAYNGQPGSVDALLAAHAQEPNPYWQASLIQILQPWATDPRVQYLGRVGVSHKESIVRSAACMILEFSQGNGPWIEPLLQDPVKEVRMAAAWTWRTHLSEQSAILDELKTSIAFTSDQPSGAMRMVQLESEAGNYLEAEQWMKKAVALDQTSAGTHEYYAILLGQLKKPKEALDQLKIAVSLDPDNARYPYLMALTYAELDQKDQTELLLRKAIKLDPRHHRAWYNLGLLLAGQNKVINAIDALRRAEEINPQSPDYPYARATLHLRQGQKMAAFEACRTVLGIDRNYQPALNLLRQIGNPNTP
ncbi:MAG: tetratricopeptide repeat protein [Verrucomicrobiae bacterium]|nr:tetratricopeptide repeat protein [Verrucomicrobiae bacterium]NNJ41768.1 tetratricopeptide repeat protein [Akkermansiaceae bacterium]